MAPLRDDDVMPLCPRCSRRYATSRGLCLICLGKEVDDLRRDRARLDWLDAQGTIEIEYLWTLAGYRYSIGGQIGGSESYATLREAIDAAMKQAAG